MTQDSKQPTAKTVSLTTPAPRSSVAQNFLDKKPSEPENIEQTAQATPLESFVESANSKQNTKLKKLNSSDRKHKAAVRYMQQQGIEDLDSINYTRFNVDIPSDLHNFLNMFARSGGDYSSMTEIAIEVLGKFAKEHGFKVRTK